MPTPNILKELELLTQYQRMATEQGEKVQKLLSKTESPKTTKRDETVAKALLKFYKNRPVKIQ